MSPEVTIIGLVRHGHGSAPMFIDGIYDSTDVPFRLIYADIASPPHVRRYLEACDRERESFAHLRFEAFVSRQSARFAALERVDTPFVVFCDNNMMFDRDWLATLLDAARVTGAALVSPTIVAGGRSIHYSGGRFLRRRGLGSLGLALSYRPQDAAAPARSRLGEHPLCQMEVDFVESHCALGETEALRLPGVLEPQMHNAHTLAYASSRLKRDHGRRILYEPAAVASIVPVAFGYDLPWMCGEYMRRDRLERSYALLRAQIGPGPATNLSLCLRWHAKHFRYLLIRMLDDGRLDGESVVTLAEAPAAVDGYDDPLRADAETRIRSDILPFVRERHPECLEDVLAWLDFQRPRWLGVCGMLLEAAVHRPYRSSRLPTG